jgi:predicted secreted acid phosphatase
MKKILHIAVALSVTLSATFTYAQEPQNLSAVKNKLIKYHDSGEYLKDIKGVIANAMSYLKERVTHNKKHKKLAIVLDIDETSLSNYKDMKELNFGGTFEEIQLAQDKGTDPVITPTLKLYKYALAHDVAVFFITGRREDERETTAQNLHAAGYSNWNKLVLRDGQYIKTSAETYKIAARKTIVAQGYDIVENIGDQESDLVGGFADKTYKLPNPYYFIP